MQRTKCQELRNILRLVQNFYSDNVRDVRELLGEEGEDLDGLVLERGASK